MNALCKLAVDSAVVVDVHMIQVPDSVVKLANLQLHLEIHARTILKLY